jgi:hypothetical protein
MTTAATETPVRAVICPYCRKPTERVGGDVIYPRYPDLHAKWFYLCRPCDAYVGCHPGSDNPLGSPANEATRRARRAAHLAFDRVWKCGWMPRSSAYRWMAHALNIRPNDMHIGMFLPARCRMVEETVKQFFVGARTANAPIIAPDGAGEGE